MEQRELKYRANKGFINQNFQVFIHIFPCRDKIAFAASIDHVYAPIRCFVAVSLRLTALQDIAYLGKFPRDEKAAYELIKFSGILKFQTEREMIIGAFVRETWTVRLTCHREDSLET